MLTVLGEALIDLIAEPAPAEGPVRYCAQVGGSPFNVAIGLARLGRPTQLMARLSTDGFGRQLRAHLDRNNVRSDATVTASEHTTLAVAALDDAGQAVYDFYVENTADWQWSTAELAAFPPASTVLHTGSLASWLAPGCELIAALAERLRGEGSVLLSYDPNIRPALLSDRDSARRRVERSVAAAHLVKASVEDLEWLYPDSDTDSVATAWLALGCELLVVTRGAGGMSAYGDGFGRRDHPGRSVTIVDTIGAGDSCMAALLDGLDRRGAAIPGGPRGLSVAALDEVLDDAALVAAITCSRAGANPPTAAELAAARAGGHPAG